MTNYERIKNMTLEELAKELALVAEWDRKELAKCKKYVGVENFMIECLKMEVDANGKWI